MMLLIEGGQVRNIYASLLAAKRQCRTAGWECACGTTWGGPILGQGCKCADCTIRHYAVPPRTVDATRDAKAQNNIGTALSSSRSWWPLIHRYPQII